jgi:ubiquinone/menaquinone biosynthesis C-methylase UbiE
MSEAEQWQLAGNAPEIYESVHVPAIFATWAPILVELGQPVPGNRALDIACGTGVVTRTVAKRVGASGRVYGIDLNAGMLAVARRVSSPGPGDAPVEWHEASADLLPLPDTSCDIAYCQAGLMFFPDRLRALTEVRRVLVSGGRVAMLVWHSSPAHSALARAMARHVSAAAEALVCAPYALASADEFGRLFRSAGFQEVTVSTQTRTARYASTRQFVESLIAGSPLAGHLALVDAGVRTALTEELQVTLRPFTNESGLSFPMGAHIATALVPR